MDWNWFFSSFCQSAAALLGIIGAFVISRLIGLNEKVFSIVDQFEELKLLYTRIKEAFGIRRFQWYNETIMEYFSGKLTMDAKEGIYEGLDRHAALDLLYKNDLRLFKLDEPTWVKLDKILSRQKTNRVYNMEFKVNPAGLEQIVTDERERINALTIESKALIRQFANNRKSASSFNSSLHSIKVIVLILCIAFPLTVVYPLHFMPMVVGTPIRLSYNPHYILIQLFSLKGFFLVIFFMTIESIFGYFLLMVNKLASLLSSIEKDNNPEYQNLAAYCEYLRDN